MRRLCLICWKGRLKFILKRRLNFPLFCRLVIYLLKSKKSSVCRKITINVMSHLFWRPFKGDDSLARVFNVAISCRLADGINWQSRFNNRCIKCIWEEETSLKLIKWVEVILSIWSSASIKPLKTRRETTTSTTTSIKLDKLMLTCKFQSHTERNRHSCFSFTER